MPTPASRLFGQAASAGLGDPQPRLPVLSDWRYMGENDGL